MTNIAIRYYNYNCQFEICRYGGTGRRTGLKILRLNKPCGSDSHYLHQKSRIFIKFSFFYFYSKLFASAGITAFHRFSLFNLFLELFKIIHCFCVSAHNLHTACAHKKSFVSLLTLGIYELHFYFSCTHNFFV